MCQCKWCIRQQCACMTASQLVRAESPRQASAVPAGFLESQPRRRRFDRLPVSKSETVTIASGPRPAWTMASGYRSAAARAWRRPAAGTLETADHHVAEGRLVAADVAEFAFDDADSLLVVIDATIQLRHAPEDRVSTRHLGKLGSRRATQSPGQIRTGCRRRRRPVGHRLGAEACRSRSTRHRRTAASSEPGARPSSQSPQGCPSEST